MRNRKSKSKTRNRKTRRRGGATNPLLEQESDNKNLLDLKRKFEGLGTIYNQVLENYNASNAKLNKLTNLNTNLAKLIDHYNETGTQDKEYDLDNALRYYSIAEDDYSTYVIESDDGSSMELNPSLDTNIKEEQEKNHKYEQQARQALNVYKTQQKIYKQAYRIYQAKYNPKPVQQQVQPVQQQVQPKKSVLRRVGSVFGM